MKKGMLIATFTAVALLIAIALLASLGDKAKTDPETTYLGEREVEVFATYYLAEEQLLYLEQSAKIAAGEVSVDGFRSVLGRYLADFNARYNHTLTLADFRFDFKDDVLVTSEKELVITTGNLEYRFRPNFRVKNPGYKEEEDVIPLK